MRFWGALLCWAALLAADLGAQGGSVIVGAYYYPQSRQYLSPGQLVTLLVRGINAPNSWATQIPLPLELSGVSAVMQEPLLGGYRKPMPLFRIQTIPCGMGTIYVCDYRAVTVQVPTDLRVVPGLGELPRPATPTITLFENGVAGSAEEFELVKTTLNIVRDCMLMILAEHPSCAGWVTHADGSLITAGNPARSGENVALYALGLGLTSPPVPEGQAAPFPAPRTEADLLATFSSGPLPAPVVPDSTWVRPDFSGLVSGFVGLYQVYLRLPDQLPPITTHPGEGPGRLTITLATSSSSDAAQIFVAP